MNSTSKIYFASDLHLGTPDYQTSRKRELLFISWLDSIKPDAQELYLIGDLFDFWHEYKTVVPKGYVRLLGKLAELADSGIVLHIFTGNHDLWMRDYLEKEIGATVYREPIYRTINGKTFFIGHGDGLGPGDHGYKFIKKVFTSSLCQFLFRWIHPDIGMQLGNYFSHQSRFATGTYEVEKYLGEDKEWLVQFCKEKLKTERIDFFLFGHRHLPLDIDLGSGSRYINTGDWLDFNSYAVWDGVQMELKNYRP